MTIIDAIDFSEAVFKINKCEICALAKAYKLIFRSFAKSETSDKSFFRIMYDLIQLNIVMNKDQWISHVSCFEYDFHLIYTHAHKSEASEIIIKAINLIETKYNDKVMFVKSNEKRFLKTQFTDYTSIKGIIYESFASDTPAQNEHIERKEDILLTKEKALRFKVNLSTYLWLWIVRTAEYIMNRIFMKKHEWKTFFEVVIESKFNLAHLIQFKAKAYSIDKHISRKKKMKIKAHIGFFVEYDSRNIFNIWVSSQHKIIRMRDVIFDEDNFYKSNQIDFAQFIKESFLINNDTVDIFRTKFIKIEEEEFNTDEKNFQLILIDAIIIIDDEADEANKNDQSQEYLFSSTSSSLKNEEQAEQSIH